MKFKVLNERKKTDNKKYYSNLSGETYSDDTYDEPELKEDNDYDGYEKDLPFKLLESYLPFPDKYGDYINKYKIKINNTIWLNSFNSKFHKKLCPFNGSKPVIYYSACNPCELDFGYLSEEESAYLSPMLDIYCDDCYPHNGEVYKLFRYEWIVVDDDSKNEIPLWFGEDSVDKYTTASLLCKNTIKEIGEIKYMESTKSLKNFFDKFNFDKMMWEG